MKLFSKYSGFILPLLIVVSSFFLLKGYFFPKFQILLALLVAPFIFRIKSPSKFSNRYFYLAILLFAGYYILAMKILLFLGLAAFLFYSVESRFGKIGLLPFIFMVCVSPALHYVVTIFTFSLRLSLSHYAADLLNTMGCNVQCNGNYFTMEDGFTFNVDKACLGLNMFNTGLSLTTLLIGVAEKNMKKYLPVLHLAGVFLTASCLLILTNFLRIIMIVFFRSLPGTTSHEMIGIFSMIVYMAVPVYFFVNYLVKRFGQETQSILLQNISFAGRHLLFPIIAFALLFFSFKSVERNSKVFIRDAKLETLTLKGFSRIKKQDGVMEFRRDSLLVYIKPAVRAFESDHPPALCWMGSGFDVERVTELKLGETVILMADIKKGATMQYTAWWYDNGKIKTTDQWRWRLSRDEPFRIINITANNKEELLKGCKEFLDKTLF